MKNDFLVLFGFALLFSCCTPPVVFDQPYPIDGEDLLEMPYAYQGTFICESDSSLLTIAPRDITVRKENYFLLPLKDIEQREDCNIDGNEMYVSGRAECIPLEFVNDSLVKGFVIEYDTLFVITEGSVARMYNGHVILSQELKDDEWAVSLLSLENNSDVKYRAITDKTKIRTVGRITAMENITLDSDKNERYKIKPTMKQFDELLNHEKIFIECEYLSRVSVEFVPAKPIIIKDL